MSEQRASYETKASEHCQRVKTHRRYHIVSNLKNFPWERMSDGLLDEIAAFMRERGFDFIGSSFTKKDGEEQW